jgi:hypothetical protein
VLSGRDLYVGLITVQRSPTECGVSEHDREALIMTMPWPTRGCRVMEKQVTNQNHTSEEIIGGMNKSSVC